MITKKTQDQIFKLGDMSRHLLCVYDHSFIVNDSVNVVLKTITDEPDLLQVHALEFEQRSNQGLYFGKMLYFQDFIQEDMDVYNFNFLDKNEQKELIEEYLLNRLVVVDPYYTFNEDRQSFFKNYTIVDVIDMEHARQFMTIPRIANEQEYAKFLDNQPFSFSNYSNEFMGVPRYISYGYSIFSVDDLTVISDNQFKVEKDSSIVRCRVDYMSGQNEGSIIDFYVDEIGFLYISKELVLNSAKQIVLTKTEEERLKKQKEEKEKKTIQFKNLLDDVYTFMKGKHLCYTMEDLINFYVCMKTKTFTLLSGMGKMEFAKSFAEYFNMNEENQTFLYIPIDSNIHTMSDLLGHYQLAAFLKHVQDFPEVMHMILLDHVNKSEQDGWLKELVQMFKQNSLKAMPCQNEELNGNDNILLVGTMEKDSMAQPVSNSILDEAFVVDLNKAKFTTFQQEQKETLDCVQTYDQDFKNIVELFKWEKGYIETFSSRQLEFFDAVNEETDCLVSYQNVEHIAKYLACAQQFMNVEQAFDIVFRQTILKKLTGTMDCIGDSVGTKLNYEGESNGSLTQIFNQYADVSDFKKSRMEIKTKVLSLKKYGYAR